MEINYLVISNWQLGASALLILINIAISFLLKLKLEKTLFFASVRMVSQLLLVGYVLHWVFTLENIWMILGLCLFMAGIASVSAVNRTRRRFRSIYWHSLVCVLAGSFLITGISTQFILQIDPWFSPQYIIPMLGMVLGNTLNGISLAMDRFMEDLASRQNQIEALLALGATRREAAHDSIKEAARTGMIPLINSMVVMGVVSLPGMMTGQILAGVNPLDAVYYQIVIVFMIASASALGVVGVVLLSFKALFNTQHQLCLQKLTITPRERG
ncbi:iron export ABC transporter permease subunit FetB [Deltaproteobacteria bacterium TL4]